MDDKLKKKLVPLGNGLYEEVRFFSDDAVQKAVDAALKNVSSNSKGVILKVDFDGTGVRAVLAAKPRDNWTIGVIGEMERAGDWKVGAHVAFEW